MMENKEIIIDEVLYSSADDEIEVSIIGDEGLTSEELDSIAVVDIMDPIDGDIGVFDVEDPITFDF